MQFNSHIYLPSTFLLSYLSTYLPSILLIYLPSFVNTRCPLKTRAFAVCYNQQPVTVLSAATDVGVMFSCSYLGARKPVGMLSEALIWSYIIQISAAIRSVHSAKLAVRSLDPSKILMVDKTRLRLNCLGIVDVLSSDPNQQLSLPQSQVCSGSGSSSSGSSSGSSGSGSRIYVILVSLLPHDCYLLDLPCCLTCGHLFVTCHTRPYCPP